MIIRTFMADVAATAAEREPAARELGRARVDASRMRERERAQRDVTQL